MIYQSFINHWFTLLDVAHHFDRRMLSDRWLGQSANIDSTEAARRRQNFGWHRQCDLGESAAQSADRNRDRWVNGRAYARAVICRPSRRRLGYLLCNTHTHTNKLLLLLLLWIFIAASRGHHKCVHRTHPETDSLVERSGPVADQILWLCVVRQFAGALLLQLRQRRTADDGAAADGVQEDIGQPKCVPGVCGHRQPNGRLHRWLSAVRESRTRAAHPTDSGAEVRWRCPWNMYVWCINLVASYVSYNNWNIFVDIITIELPLSRLQYSPEEKIRRMWLNGVQPEQRWSNKISMPCSSPTIFSPWWYVWPEVGLYFWQFQNLTSFDLFESEENLFGNLCS